MERHDVNYILKADTVIRNANFITMITKDILLECIILFSPPVFEGWRHQWI